MDMLGGVVVLDDLVLHHAHARLSLGHFGQGDPGLVRRHGGLLADLVHLLLGKGGKYRLGLPHFDELGLQAFHRVDLAEFRCHNLPPKICKQVFSWYPILQNHPLNSL